MKDLIEALTIIMKYIGDEKYPTNCDHDELRFNTIDTTKVSKEDLKRLEQLGFDDDREDIGGLISFRFGSN